MTKALTPSPDAFHFKVQRGTAKVALASRSSDVIAGASFVRGTAARPMAIDDPGLVDAANRLRAAYAQKLRSDIPAEMDVSVQDATPGEAVLASADPSWDGPTYTTCNVLINRNPSTGRPSGYSRRRSHDGASKSCNCAFFPSRKERNT